MRQAQVNRKTNETEIALRVNIDGTRETPVSTRASASSTICSTTLPGMA